MNADHNASDVTSEYYMYYQIPSYIIWLFLSTFNITSAILTISVLNSFNEFKSDNQFLMTFALLVEMFTSTWNIGLTCWHLSRIFSQNFQPMLPGICFKFTGQIAASANLSCLFNLVIGIDRLLAILQPIWYAGKSRCYKYVLVYTTVSFGLLHYLLSNFDQFDQNRVPVCLIRAVKGKYLSLFDSYYQPTVSCAPILLYILMYVVLYRKCRASRGTALELSEKRLKDRVLKTMTFVTVYQTVCYTFTAYSTVILNHLPYRGSFLGPYFGSLYFTQAIAIFLCYMKHVEDFKQKLRELLERCGFRKRAPDFVWFL